jgi:hypothetical protein
MIATASNRMISPRSCAPTISRRTVWKGLFLFNGDFGRLDYREDGVSVFEIHSRH